MKGTTMTIHKAIIVQFEEKEPDFLKNEIRGYMSTNDSLFFRINNDGNWYCVEVQIEFHNVMNKVIILVRDQESTKIINLHSWDTSENPIDFAISYLDERFSI